MVVPSASSVGIIARGRGKRGAADRPPGHFGERGNAVGFAGCHYTVRATARLSLSLSLSLYGRFVFLFRHGLEKNVALHQITVDALQKGDLIRRFHAFGHGLDMELANQPDDALNQDGVLFLILAVNKEQPVDLECVDGQAFQQAERGIALPEIVNGTGKAFLLQLFHVPLVYCQESILPLFH